VEIGLSYSGSVPVYSTFAGRRDIVADGFDAGIHFGEYIQKDMIAVRVSPDHRPAFVGSPAYVDSHPRPKVGYRGVAEQKTRLRFQVSKGSA
jgi:hypothetical protein